jgi:hypothetical protein
LFRTERALYYILNDVMTHGAEHSSHLSFHRFPSPASPLLANDEQRRLELEAGHRTEVQGSKSYQECCGPQWCVRHDNTRMPTSKLTLCSRVFFFLLFENGEKVIKHTFAFNVISRPVVQAQSSQPKKRSPVGQTKHTKVKDSPRSIIPSSP